MDKILELKFGSHLYGTNTLDSDTDYKVIYIPTAKEICLGKYKKTIQIGKNKKEFERNTKDDVETEILSLDRYLELLMEGQTMALDILFAPKDVYTYKKEGPLGANLLDEIYKNKDRLLTKNVNAFVGYSRQQASKYGIKGSRMDALKRVAEVLEQLTLHKKLSDYPLLWPALIEETKGLVSLEKTPLIEIAMLKGKNSLVDQAHLHVNGRYFPMHASVKWAKDIVNKMLDGYGKRANKAHLNGGVDWKALSHAVRVSNEAIELLETGQITFPRPDRDLLLKIKKGELPYEQVATMIEEGLVKLYKANSKSTLREEPDREWAQEFIYNVHKQVVKESK